MVLNPGDIADRSITNYYMCIVAISPPPKRGVYGGSTFHTDIAVPHPYEGRDP